MPKPPNLLKEIIHYLARERKREFARAERKVEKMPRTKSGEFNQIAYQNEFNKKNYDRIEIKVKKGKKAVIQEAAKIAGQSVNEFINQAIDERMGKTE